MIVLFVFLLLATFNVYDEIIRWINNHIMVMPLIFLLSTLIFIILMSIFFFLLTQNSIRYLNEIMFNLQKISQGQFEICISKRTSDELGELSEIINNMTNKIKVLIEEERSWEKSKGELINNVSHDLRTPLTSILGYIELIKEHKYSDEADLQHYSDIVYSKCVDLKKLIDDLFEYSKLSSKELRINKTTINLGGLLEQVIVGFIPVLTEAHMEFRMFFDNIKIAIHADPVLLARLFDNIINNAVSYGKEGRYIDVELTQRVDEAVVRIINYGEIIHEIDLPHIFERFYRSEKSRSRQKGGSGLGLAIVRSIADIHDACVNVTSKEGKTVFEIRLKVV